LGGEELFECIEEIARGLGNIYIYGVLLFVYVRIKDLLRGCAFRDLFGEKIYG
jgi:hypothetical protein